MKQIPLHNAKGAIVAHALVSDEDHGVVSQRKWHKSAYGYAISSNPRENGRTSKTWLHKLVYERKYEEKPTHHVDHSDRNRLNNQRDNLRPATPTENVLNRQLGKNNTTGHFGVRLDKRTQRYQAFSSFKGEWFSIGYFDLKEDAALAHDLHMKETYPNEYLNLNLPDASEAQQERVRMLLVNAKKRRGKSRYRGVIHFPYDGRQKCWHARIAHEGKQKGLGYYETEREAALAYNAKATELLGAKAKLNNL